MNEMVKLLDTMGTINCTDSDYTIDGYTVPRVTKILQKCIHSDSLMRWANSLGFKHKSYTKTLNEAAEIGTHTHNSIDAFMDDNTYEANEFGMPHESYYAYLGFLKWFNDINLVANVKVIFHEKKLVCKYFGGTLDGLYEINGKLYVVDYKTSNTITYKYFLQLSAYIYMLREVLGINADGCIILQLSKTSPSYNEYVLNFDNPQHFDYIKACEMTFLSLVFSYYNISKVEQGYKLINWEVPIK